MRFGKLDLNLLVTLDALLKERSVTKAAMRLSLSPSATSNALARLRDYFQDELLVQTGRRMILTPRAEKLQVPIHDILLRVESTVSESTAFDPSSSTRAFRIIATDYIQMVLAPHLMALIHEIGSPVEINVLPWTSSSKRDLELGEVDFLIASKNLLSDAHPFQGLYSERLVCLVWEGSALAKEPLTYDRFLNARHAKVKAWSGLEDPIASWYPRPKGYTENLAITTYSMAALSGLIEGTDCVAVLPYLLARKLAAIGGGKIMDMPFETPEMELCAQWNNYNQADPGIKWILGLFDQAVGRMENNS